MRVLLINPYYPISETPSPPLGLAYLAAVLAQAGVEVKILDYVIYPYRRDALESVLNEFKPQIAGTTAVSMTVDHSRQSISDVKAIDPEILTLMGGPHITFCAQETLETFSELDAVVIGEGEEMLVELLRAVESAGNLDTVSGIAYRAGSKIMITAKRKWIKDLDALPFPARSAARVIFQGDRVGALIDFNRVCEPRRGRTGLALTSSGRSAGIFSIRDQLSSCA